MNKLHRIWLVLLFFPLLISCGIRQPLPAYEKNRNCYPIEVAAGPEDFLLDKWHTKPRLLISSHERREPERYGDIYSYDMKTGYSEKMKRTGEPENLATFQPHGMDIRQENGNTLLYVILHDLYNRSTRDENGIAIYRVLDNELVFQELLVDEIFLWSPNDISVLDNGEIYATNDYRSELDIYLRKKTSHVVHYSVQKKSWSVVASDLSFANGILALPDRVYVAATRSDKLIEYSRKEDGTLGTERIIAQIKGLDNIMPYGKQLLVAAHFDDLAFFRHHKDEEVPAPSVVFLINPEDSVPDESKMVVYADDGRQISAASTAFVYEDKLYISQVFGSKILVCDAADLAKGSLKN
jgi:hypothetical protein